MAYLCEEDATDDTAQRQLRAACDRYARFHQFAPPCIARNQVRRFVPDVLVDLGELRALIYRSDRGRRGRMQTYIHFMETAPRLACDPDGTQLFILGGAYRVTKRGIEG